MSGFPEKPRLVPSSSKAVDGDGRGGDVVAEHAPQVRVPPGTQDIDKLLNHVILLIYSGKHASALPLAAFGPKF